MRAKFPFDRAAAAISPVVTTGVAARGSSWHAYAVSLDSRSAFCSRNVNDFLTDLHTIIRAPKTHPRVRVGSAPTRKRVNALPRLPPRCATRFPARRAGTSRRVLGTRALPKRARASVRPRVAVPGRRRRPAPRARAPAAEPYRFGGRPRIDARAGRIPFAQEFF